MKPEDVPDEIVDKALQASEASLNTAFDDAELLVLRNWMRRSLALAWDGIYAHGYTDGFSDNTHLEAGAAAKVMRDHRAVIWSLGGVTCRCDDPEARFTRTDFQISTGDAIDRNLAKHEAHVAEALFRAGLGREEGA
jgi:hypothetical protein